MLRSKLFNHSLLLAILAVTGNLLAQKPEDLAGLMTKYKGNHYCYVLRKEAVRIDMVKGVPQQKSAFTTDIMILNETGATALSESRIQFSPFENIGEIDAYSNVPKGSSFKKVPAGNFKTQDAETSGSVFHDGAKETSFNFYGLVPGAVRHLTFENTVSEHRFPMSFSFYSYVPAEAMIFEIDHDTAVHLTRYDFHLDGAGIVFEEKLQRGRRIWTWTRRDVKAMRNEAFAPEPAYYQPTVVCQIGSYTYKNKQVEVLNNITGLHNWYRESVDKILADPPSQELIDQTVAITKDLSTPLEKVRAVYYWVQSNIKYIAFEEGEEGFVPRKANLVFNKKFGDCKDMATLIHTMLKCVGVTTYTAWIGSREIPFKYSEIPSSVVDNHMIAIYFDGDKPYFLDATSSFQPMDLPTIFILGKEALLHKSSEDFALLNVTIPPVTATQLIDTTRITINGRRITGKSNVVISGYYNVLINEHFKDVPADKMAKRMEDVFQKGNNSFKINQGQVNNVSERNKNLEAAFEFQIENYASGVGNETYVNLVLEKDIAKEFDFNEERTAPFEQDFLCSDNYTVILEVPENMQVKSLPANCNYENEFTDFSITYSQKGNQVYATVLFKIKTLSIPAAEFSKWKAFYQFLKKNTSETVVLETKK